MFFTFICNFPSVLKLRISSKKQKVENWIYSFYKWIKKKIPKGSLLWIVYRYVKKIILNREYRNPITIYKYIANRNIALHKYKAIYFPIPKTACSSLKKLCADLLNMKIKGKDLNEDIHSIHYPYVKHDKINKKYKDYFKFCFVRNPWDRLVSCYINKVFLEKNNTIQETKTSFISHNRRYKKFRLGMSFEEFINAVCSIPDEKSDSHFRSQCIFITNDEGKIIVDFIGKFENFEKDLYYICNKINAEIIKPPHLMKSKREEYRKYYTEKTKEMVRQRYIKDINMFGYKF